MATPLSPVQTHILHIVTKAARDAMPCPTNSRLREMTGLSDKMGPTMALQALERRGYITITRAQSNSPDRRITIVALGITTPSPVKLVSRNREAKPSSRHSFWTEDRKATLRTLWANNVRADEIGKRIGATQSAVLGMADRLNLETRGGFANKVAIVPKVEIPKDLSPLAGKLALVGGCQFFIGSGYRSDWRHEVCCGKPVAGYGQPYCAEHHAVCYRPSPARKIGVAYLPQDLSGRLAFASPQWRVSP